MSSLKKAWADNKTIWIPDESRRHHLPDTGRAMRPWGIVLIYRRILKSNSTVRDLLINTNYLQNFVKYCFGKSLQMSLLFWEWICRVNLNGNVIIVDFCSFYSEILSKESVAMLDRSLTLGPSVQVDSHWKHPMADKSFSYIFSRSFTIEWFQFQTVIKM